MGINIESLPATIELSLQVENSPLENQYYGRAESASDQYYLEIFRRATIYHDQRAWELLQGRFYDIVRSWMRRHPRREIACRFDSEDNYIAQAFERFWQATAHNREVEFTSLAAALSYLRASLNGAIMDTLRMYSRPREAPLFDPGYPEPAAEDPEDDGWELWEILKSVLPHERERRLAYLLFHCGLKPREIVQYCGKEFGDVREVYRLRRNIIERLMRNVDQIRWRLGTHDL